MNKPRGRPRGNPDTKALLASTARALFLQRGYRATTVRAIAAAAGVDSALVSYHFGSKQGLFGQSLGLSCVSPDGLDQALQGDQAGLADRLIVAVLASWDSASPGSRDLALVDEDTLRALRDYLGTELQVRIAEFLRGPDAGGRAAAAVGVIGGLIFTRYLNRLAPVAGLSRTEIRRFFTPALHAALHAAPSRAR